jgi:hypothetical protein
MSETDAAPHVVGFALDAATSTNRCDAAKMMEAISKPDSAP